LDSGGIFLTVMGFYIIILVFPYQSCTKLGMGNKVRTVLLLAFCGLQTKMVLTHANYTPQTCLNEQYVKSGKLVDRSEDACFSLHIIAWMDTILFSLLALLLVLQLCIAKVWHAYRLVKFVSSWLKDQKIL